MKKTFQIIRIQVDGTIDTTTTNSKTFTEQLRQDYAKCTGVFVTPKNANTDFSQITASLKIAQNEILPLDFDLSLIAFTGEVSLTEACYNFASDNIPARSSEMEFTVTNPTDKPIEFNLYLLLENK